MTSISGYGGTTPIAEADQPEVVLVLNSAVLRLVAADVGSNELIRLDPTATLDKGNAPVCTMCRECIVSTICVYALHVLCVCEYTLM